MVDNNSVLQLKIDNLEKEQSRMAAEIRSLKKWKEHCTMAAAGWGGICIAVMTMGGIVQHYWENIKHYFADQK